jgi:hypothetical protein
MVHLRVVRNIAVMMVVGLLALTLGIPSAGADMVTVGSGVSTVVNQVAVAQSAPASLVQADPVSSLFGLLLQSIGGAFLNWDESIMNTAIADGPAALGSWQIGKFVWDVGCQWGVAGEQLVPGLPPTFPFKCTLFPRWPY